MAKQVPAPPYAPGFGRRPPVVAGRDALVDDTARVLEAGPDHPRFCRALLGSRGTGKTVLPDVVGDVRHLDDRHRPQGACALGGPGPWPAPHFALSGRAAVPAPPAGPKTSAADAAGSWPDASAGSPGQPVRAGRQRCRQETLHRS